MSSEKNILRSTGIIGGSQVIVMFLSLIKSKAIAILLGPSGVGLLSALQASVNLIQGAAGLGYENSAVREIARSAVNSDERERARSVRVLRINVWLTGGLGFMLTMLLAPQLSFWTFDSYDYVWEIRLLSLAVLFNLIKGGQYALLQGLRKLRSLALLSILGTLSAAVIALPVFYLLRLDGVAVYLVLIALSQLIVSWFYARQVKQMKISLGWKAFISRTRGMLELGLAFMGGSIITLATTYWIKVLIIDKLDVTEAGIYQAAFVLSGLFINTLLGAMGKDFYPRLSSVAFDAQKEGQLINDQINVGVTLAAPGLLFTIALAPYFIPVLYSNEFMGAVDVLRWISLAFFLRLFSWPIGYAFISRAQTKLFFSIQLITNLVLTTCSVMLIDNYGIEGIGMSYLILYVFHLSFLSVLGRYYLRFQWSKRNLRSLLLYLIIFSTSTWVLFEFENVISVIIVSAIACVLAIVALRRVSHIYEYDSIKSLIIGLTRKVKR